MLVHVGKVNMTISYWKFSLWVVGVLLGVVMRSTTQADYTLMVEVETIVTVDGPLFSSNCTGGGAVQNCQNITLAVCLSDMGPAGGNCSLWEEIYMIISDMSVFESPVIEGTWPVDGGLLNLSLHAISNDTEMLALSDEYSIILNLTATEPTLRGTYTGELGVANTSLFITLACVDDYYGLDCGVYCAERNDSTGHYTCNETDGSVVCLEGYTNSTLNCSQCVPAPNCSHGGYCNSPGECICSPGFTGDNCETEMPLTLTPVTFSVIIQPTPVSSVSSIPVHLTSSIFTHSTISYLLQHSSSMTIHTGSLSRAKFTKPSALLPSPSGMGGRQEGGNDSGAIVGAVIGSLIILGVIATVIVVIFVLVKWKTKPRSPPSGPLWYIKVNPTVRRPKSYTSTENGGVRRSMLSLRSLTPDFLVVRHHKNKSTVPNGGQYLSVPAARSSYSTQSPAEHWPEPVPMNSEDHTLTMSTNDPTVPMSGDDATLPRNIRSPSAETDSTQPHGRMSAATSSTYQPEWNLKVYQMPSFENDSVIMTNMGAVDGEEKGEVVATTETRNSRSL